jgi:hypothetical protein
VALPSCKRCGKKDPQRMHGLMSLWFGPLVDLEADLGYFHLCPQCHDELIVPELERIQNRILELHPAAQRHHDEMELANGRQPSGADTGAGEAADGGGDDHPDDQPDDASASG